MADSLKKVEAAGGKLSDTEKLYAQMGDNPQPIPEYIDYVKQRAGDLYEKFGTNVDEYVNTIPTTVLILRKPR